MRLLKIIKEIDAYPDVKSKEPKEWKLRSAARAVVFDGDGKIALLHVAGHNYYKLPGGGIEPGETVEQALERECLEEIGCKIMIGEEIGAIVEYRNKFEIKQESVCFVAKLVGLKGDPEFTEDETNEGFRLIWVKIEEAKNLIKNSKPDSYDGPFIIIRDLTFLNQVNIC
jgi:8-oxo-dGTP pyrophosphatase MutT (NUDIX family)